MIFVVKSYKKINNKSVFSALPLRKKTSINCSRSLSLAQNFFLFVVVVVVVVVLHARVYYCRLQREILRRNVSLFIREVF